MQPTLCSRCKKNVAVVFISKIENGQTINEGLCLKCAKELGIKPVDDMISRMGLSDDDLENLSGEMGDMMNGLEGLLNPGDKDTDGEDDEQDRQRGRAPAAAALPAGGCGTCHGNLSFQKGPGAEAAPGAVFLGGFTRIPPAPPPAAAFRRCR